MASGEGQHFVDVEQGWTLEHDSLRRSSDSAPLTGTIDDASRPHGTAVLGIVCGASTTGGYVGFAPRVASVHVASRVENVYDAISSAVEKLVDLNRRDHASAGGVLLLETQAQLPNPQGNNCNLPIETNPDLFALVHKATKLGITVVEPAGNGCDAVVPETGIDLDDYADANGVRILRRDSPRGDSGAIVVGAARAKVQDGKHRRVGSSNYGSRVDCYAWGEGVVAPWSTGRAPFATTGCAGDFGETSAAAAIIAGVALIVQGVVCTSRAGKTSHARTAARDPQRSGARDRLYRRFRTYRRDARPGANPDSRSPWRYVASNSALPAGLTRMRKISSESGDLLPSSVTTS